MRIGPKDPPRPATVSEATTASPAVAKNASVPSSWTADGQRPMNQPSNRFRGQPFVQDRASDPLPAWLGAPFEKHGIILEPDPNVPWKAKAVFNPAAIVKDGQIHLFPRCQDLTGAGQWYGTSRVGHLVSDDGFAFRPASDPDQPVMAPTEPWELPGGCEDPRVVQLDNGKYLMTYTAYDGHTARLAFAVSDDLVQWEKKGLVFRDEVLKQIPALEGNPWTKAGVVVPKKIDGNYIMYFGENKVLMATSKDGLHWDVANGGEPVLTPRPGYFDQGLVEAGPSPWVDEEGIHLLYHGDSPPHGYQVGEVVFDVLDPARVIRRSTTPYLKPDQDFELGGQVDRVVFAEGLAQLHDTIFLYYGAADGRVAVATAPVGKRMSVMQAQIDHARSK